MFVGSNSGNQFEGALPKSGAYKVRVYMMRSAARREDFANYRLEMASLVKLRSLLGEQIMEGWCTCKRADAPPLW